MQVISPSELNAMVARGESLLVVDVRSPAEYGEAHVPFAVNHPLPDLDAHALRAEIEKDGKRLVFICKSGTRGRSACEKAIAAGVSTVCNVDGGTGAWIEAGLPVIRGAKSFSVERQARVVIGSMVLMGVALGAFVHPYLLGIAAFFGGGLLYAGLFDSCPLANCLAAMPWNRRKPGCCN